MGSILNRAILYRRDSSLKPTSVRIDGGGSVRAAVSPAKEVKVRSPSPPPPPTGSASCRDSRAAPQIYPSQPFPPTHSNPIYFGGPLSLFLSPAPSLLGQAVCKQGLPRMNPRPRFAYPVDPQAPREDRRLSRIQELSRQTGRGVPPSPPPRFSVHPPCLLRTVFFTWRGGADVSRRGHRATC